MKWLLSVIVIGMLLFGLQAAAQVKTINNLPLVAAGVSGNLDNFLPNVNWQSWAIVGGGVNYITKMNAAGTAAQTAVSSSAFTPSSNTPTFTTSNTQQLKNGDLVIITGNSFKWTYNGVAGTPPVTAVRVTNLIPNTSFQVTGQLGGLSPASSVATTVTPISPGYSGATGIAADGWDKTSTLTVWPDDFAANAYPGAIRTMGVLKDLGTAETVYWACQPTQLAKYAGRTVTFGVPVFQKVQGGSGTWKLWINDGVTTTYSGNGTGASVSGFQFLSVTANISAAATQLLIEIEFDGAAGDVYYVALPTAVLGSTLTAANCRQMPSELILVPHWNPPLLTPLTGTFPVATLGGSSYYGWQELDLEAMSFGSMHNSVRMVDCKVELTTSTVGAMFFTGSNMTGLSFGPQAVTQVSGVMIPGQGILPLAADGTFTIFTNTSGLSLTNATFDLGAVWLSMPY
jgi:hypothetical protein